MTPKIPKRTHATHLSDDELILFDAVFDGMHSFSALRSEEFGMALNFPEEHEHHFADDALQRVLENFVATGLFRSEVEEEHLKRTFYGLTAEGGRLWELERQPDWMRYINGAWSTPTDWDDMENAPWLVDLESISLEIAKAYWLSEIPEVEMAEVEITRLENSPIVYWKIVPEVYVLGATSPPFKSEPFRDWEAYEQRRIWWVTLMELGGLQRK